jgi:dsRNA-specific ribonuclease
MLYCLNSTIMSALLYNEEDIYITKNQDGTDVYCFDPYNSLNREITQEDVQTILEKYGIKHKIYNFNLYKRAFIHRSYTRKPEYENATNGIIIVPKPNDCLPLHTKSNERLEFVGDGVLECITKFYLYRRFPKENEGFMTEKKIALVKNEAIGKLAMEIGLHKWFILSRDIETKQTRTNLKKLGCLFEAFIGALFLDFNRMDVKEKDWTSAFLTGPGFQMVQIFVENVFEKHVDWMNLIQNDDNYKNILQVKIQKEFKVTPHYMDISPPTNDKKKEMAASAGNDVGFHMGVYLCLGQPIFGLSHFDSIPLSQFSSFSDIHQYMSEKGKLFLFLGEGQHKIKKKAEQIACNSAIQQLSHF